MLREDSGPAGRPVCMPRRRKDAPARKNPPSPGVSTLMGVERKLATVLFVDLVDSTAFVSRTDPEIVRRRVNRFFEDVSLCIERHGGLVEKFAGDAVMAAFGIPQAHEDDAERAVRAALGMLDGLEELGLEARIGIEAGGGGAGDTDPTFATGGGADNPARPPPAARPRG